MMRHFWKHKGKAGDAPDVERLLAAARPEPSALTEAAADRVYRQALEEAFGQGVSTVRPAPRRAWGFAAASALATLLIAVGGALWMNGETDRPFVKPPVATPPRPAVVVAVPPVNTSPKKPAAAAVVKPGGVRRNARTVRADLPKAVRSGRTIRRPALAKAPRALPDRERPAVAPSSPAGGVVMEDHIARLLVMVDPGSAALNVDVERKDESAPGFARAAAYEPDENGGTVTEVTLTAADGTETALYREGWHAGDGDGDSGTLRVEVTRVTEPEPAMPGSTELEPAMPGSTELDAPNRAEPEIEPADISENLKDSAGEGVR